MRYSVLLSVVAMATVLATQSPSYGADPSAACEYAKLKAAGKRESCVAVAAGRAQLGRPSDATRCETKFSAALASADTKAAARSAACRYIDNGDGTVSDLDTGLMWQQTDDADGLTDKDKAYTWNPSWPGEEPTGTAFTEFLAGLNGGTATDGSGPTTGCYAGHCDWRIPVIEELTTIVDCSFGNPCIDQSAFGPIPAANDYWSSSTSDSAPFNAWNVGLDDGNAAADHKDRDKRARAVRGGL